MNRRTFLQTVGVAGFAGLANSQSASTQPQSSSITLRVPELVNGSIQLRASVTLPPPHQSGIEHIVVVMMENRSFDHFLGWVPGADGKQAGLTYLDKSGHPRSTGGLAPDYTGCPHPDPDHSYDQSRVAYDNGAMDGFLRAGGNDAYAIGYYSESDLPFYSALARNYTVWHHGSLTLHVKTDVVLCAQIVAIVSGGSCSVAAASFFEDSTVSHLFGYGSADESALIL
jgi:phospholipase C